MSLPVGRASLQFTLDHKDTCRECQLPIVTGERVGYVNDRLCCRVCWEKTAPVHTRKKNSLTQGARRKGAKWRDGDPDPLVSRQTWRTKRTGKDVLVVNVVNGYGAKAKVVTYLTATGRRYTVTQKNFRINYHLIN